MTPATRNYDRQASGFDRRAGVGADMAGAVARALLDIVSPRPDDVLVELGAGTGEIGRHLMGRVRYVAVDSSRGMLAAFKTTCGVQHSGRDASAASGVLIHADGERTWPIRAASVAAVFASRVAHLLDPEHLSAEVRRVCRPGGLLLLGRVRREANSPQAKLRRRREVLLHELGITPVRASTDDVLHWVASAGGARIASRTVASRLAQAAPTDVLSGWQSMTSMGGVELPEAVRGRLLWHLREWAGAEFGDPALPVPYTESYVLTGVRTPMREPERPPAVSAIHPAMK